MVGSDDPRAARIRRPVDHVRAAVSLFVVLFTACTAGGGSAIGPSTPPGGPRSNIWTPTPGERWQYQLQSHKGAFPSTGGINVDICDVPFAGGSCVRPTVFDIDLYANLKTAELNTAAVAAIHA